MLGVSGLFTGQIRKFCKLTIVFVSIVVLTTFLPNLPPYTSFSAIEIEDLQPRVGPLKLNNALNNVETLYKEKLLGPETFQILNGDLYTGIATGEILKISPGGHITFVTKIGKPCMGLANEHICGRPLGFEIDEKKNLLYVCDAYYGIWKVDLKNDKKTLLVSPHVEIDGVLPKLFNSLTLAKNGDFYWTDSSSDYELKDGAMTLLSDPSGRLLHYNAAKNESKTLLDKLWFSNGVVLSPNEEFVVVAETFQFRLLKYYLSGPKKGKSEVFVSGLPGTPDVLRVLPDGSGILAGLYTVVDDTEPFIVKSLAKAPLVRQFLARFLSVTKIGFEALSSVITHAVLEDIVYKIGHFQMLAAFTSNLSGLAYIDWNGNILNTYYNTDGSVKSISDGIVFNGKLLTGSPHVQNFIGAVPAPPELQKAFAPIKSSPPPAQKNPKVEKPAVKLEAKQAAPVESKPAPKATTPKPVEPKPTPKPEEATKKPVAAKPTPKPVDAKATPKPVDAKATPKPVDAKPTPKPAAAATKHAETKPVPKQDGPAPTAKSPSSESKLEKKENAQTTTPSPKTEKPKDKPVKQKPAKENKPPRKIPEVVPIQEDIPSDTAKPTKETLKVIRKEGPVEIPNPNM